MNHKKRRGTGTGHGRGNALTPTDREFIYQVYSFVENGNLRATAQRCGVHERTVTKVIAEMANKPRPQALQETHLGMAQRLQGKTMAKAEQVLDSISPVDLESGYFELKNEKDEVIGRKYYGPQATQKALAFGIITDKAARYAELVKANRDDERAGQLMIPQEIDALKDAILSRITSLQLARFNFKTDAPNVLEQTQDLLAAEVATAEEIIHDDFADDNPGRV